VKVEAVIVGGGKGKRFGNTLLPKQFCYISGKSILDWTLQRFEFCPVVTSIILVVPKGMQKEAENILSLSCYRKLKQITEGGKERMDSVYEGLRFVDEDAKIVLVHDGVRPLVSQSLIKAVVDNTKIYGAVVPGIPIKETIKEIDPEGFVTKTIPREKVYIIQTPQGFKTELIKFAYRQAKISKYRASDDAGLVEKIGGRVRIIPGEETNIKITTSFDFQLAKILLDMERP